MKKLFILAGSIAVLAFTLVADTPQARGAPTRPSTESAVYYAQFVPAIDQQDAAAATSLLAIEVIGPFNDKMVPTEIATIARVCDVREVVATGTEKVGGVTRTSIAIFGDDDKRRADEMIAAIETQRRPFVQRI